MSTGGQSSLPTILKENESELLHDWVRLQLADLSGTRHGLDERQLKDESKEFLRSLVDALQNTDARQISSREFSDVRENLESICKSRLNLGFSPSEVATFVFSFKQPLFTRLRTHYGADTQALTDETWIATTLLDKLGLYTTEVYQKNRNELIARQHQDMLELSTPVVELWEGILALPLIGTLDSARTQIVMQNLLQAIVDTGSEIAIIDITGVPTVDTLVAQHLLKTVAAARLMGADCIISGIRPQIAQTIIHLGVDLTNVITKASLSGAFATALRRSGLTVTARKSTYTGNSLEGE